MSDIKHQLKADMKVAMKSGDKRRLGAIRLAIAAILQREIDGRIELDDAQVVAVLDKMAKQRHESMQHYRSAGRGDLLQQEEFELEVLRHYLPDALDEREIDTMIAAAIESCGASAMKDMGRVMGQLKPQLQGRADMGAVSTKIKTLLNL
jgi:uncharacterized protein YqeY